jgi:hypothetical protein
MYYMKSMALKVLSTCWATGGGGGCSAASVKQNKTAYYAISQKQASVASSCVVVNSESKIVGHIIGD